VPGVFGASALAMRGSAPKCNLLRNDLLNTRDRSVRFLHYPGQQGIKPCYRVTLLPASNISPVLRAVHERCFANSCARSIFEADQNRDLGQLSCCSAKHLSFDVWYLASTLARESISVTKGAGMHWTGKRDTGQDACKRDGRLRRVSPASYLIW